MIRLSYIALSLALALGFTSCSDDDYNERGIGNDFKVSRSEIALAASAPQTVTVRAASAPAVVSDSGGSMLQLRLITEPAYTHLTLLLTSTQATTRAQAL